MKRKTKRSKKLIAYWRHVHTVMVEQRCDVQYARRYLRRNDP